MMSGDFIKAVVVGADGQLATDKQEGTEAESRTPHREMYDLLVRRHPAAADLEHVLVRPAACHLKNSP
jgi:hypothetical protein